MNTKFGIMFDIHSLVFSDVWTTGQKKSTEIN